MYRTLKKMYAIFRKNHIFFGKDCIHLCQRCGIPLNQWIADFSP